MSPESANVPWAGFRGLGSDSSGFDSGSCQRLDDSSGTSTQSYRAEALSDQVRAYRGIYQRYLTDPSGISFNDVIVTQQTLGSVLNQYIDTLQSQWQSTVDMGELLQVDDLFQMGDPTEVAKIPAF